jgi:hypothetical protein
VLFWLILQSIHQCTLWDLLAPEKECSRDSHLGVVELELLVEIVNPIPAGVLESQGLREKSKRSGGLPKSRPEAR